MHKARGTFVTGAPVLPWAFAIARRLVLDRVRRDRRAPPGRGDLDPDPVSLVGTADRPDQVVEAREVARRLAAGTRPTPRVAADGLRAPEAGRPHPGRGGGGSGSHRDGREAQGTPRVRVDPRGARRGCGAVATMTPPPEPGPAPDLKGRVLAAVRAEPAPTQSAVRQRGWLTFAICTVDRARDLRARRRNSDLRSARPAHRVDLRRLDRGCERGGRVRSSPGPVDAGALDRIADLADHRPAPRPTRMEDRGDGALRSGDDGAMAGATGLPVLAAVSRDGRTAPGGVRRDASPERSGASGDRRRGARPHGRGSPRARSSTCGARSRIFRTSFSGTSCHSSSSRWSVRGWGDVFSRRDDGRIALRSRAGTRVSASRPSARGAGCGAPSPRTRGR